MAINEEIRRLQLMRDMLRTKLVGMDLVQSSANLQACVIAVDDMANNGAVSGNIATAAQEYAVPAGYHNGEGKVAIAAAEQAKLVNSNIKAGVTLLGVLGTYSGESATLQAKSVTPTKTEQDVTADEGYDALSQVTVAAIPDAYQDVTSVTATAADVIANKIIVLPDGSQVAGTMPNVGTVRATIDGLAVTSYTIPMGYHSGTGTVSLTEDIENALKAL